MAEDNRDKVHRVNCLSGDLEALYHRAALKLGVSDSVSWVLYMVYEKGDGCLLKDIYSEKGISKQTINSAMRKLESEGVLFLQHDHGCAKRVCLTEHGRDYLQRTAARLYRAECRAFDDWTEDEIEEYLRLMEKYNSALKIEIDKMEANDT